MSALTTFLAALTPPPVVTPEQYDGWQWTWKFFVFRPATLKNEAYLLAALLFYALFAYVGSSSNSNKARKWMAAHLSVYQQQFSKPEIEDGLIEDGRSDFFNFSTGRRNVTSLHTIFTLRPRHDFFQWLYQTGKTFVDLQYRPIDEIQLDFKLTSGALPHDFVWAVVAKDELMSVKDGRWDLTFTKTTENPSLPQSLSVMSEFADVTENILKRSGGFSLSDVLQDTKILPYFRSLSVTDQPRDRPTVLRPANEREKHVIVSLRVPSSSHIADTVPFVTGVFQFVDALTKISLRPETRNKLKKIREELDKGIKEEFEKEKREEALESKQAAKRKAEEERLSKLSAADQKKELEKERKRSLRKTQAKVQRK
ncbi:hypothetical protein K443DRAFT_673970 [Laccaria amethystina LaAM-08-1]|uniref:DUF1682-domain-containing protein n=1 Tax=Laccaria amethystina LaAM-08-1 TaxID=1095629 RepID=A0A0C9X3F6_9AGAR|nr:hypothetical protein K443DRAFT_673970 [Laccaria amethystina LaAM-08-1]